VHSDSGLLAARWRVALWALLGLAALVLPIVPSVSALSRFAYVGMHYEGTPRDDEYLLGLRVLIKSVKLTGTKMDFVVLISNNVRESTKQRLLDDGAHLREITNLENPFRSEAAAARRNKYNNRFIFAFNKLYLWNLTDYERVMYLDSDNIALDQPLDDLFLVMRSQQCDQQLAHALIARVVSCVVCVLPSCLAVLSITVRSFLCGVYEPGAVSHWSDGDQTVSSDVRVALFGALFVRLVQPRRRRSRLSGCAVRHRICAIV
jgi:hypothetical protein